jgi:XTP/dITP diphosphohydrolase
MLVTTPRAAGGALTWDAWTALRSGPVFTRDQDHPHRPGIEAAGVAVEAVDPELPAIGIARLLRSTAREAGTAVWLTGPGGDADVARAVGEVANQSSETGEPLELEVVHGGSSSSSVRSCASRAWKATCSSTSPSSSRSAAKSPSSIAWNAS